MEGRLLGRLLLLLQMLLVYRGERTDSLYTVRRQRASGRPHFPAPSPTATCVAHIELLQLAYKTVYSVLELNDRNLELSAVRSWRLNGIVICNSTVRVTM